MSADPESLPAEWLVKCIFAVLHLPSGNGGYSSLFIGLLESQFILQFIIRFFVSLLFLSPSDVMLQNRNIVSLSHCGENQSGP